MNFKTFVPLDNFFSERSMYDVPIYQLIVAGISTLLQADPLFVVRCIDLTLWFLALVGGLLIIYRYTNSVSVYFMLLMATSPLILHYYSVALPDNLAISLSVVGLYLLLRRELASTAIAAILLTIAALIKSPIPFVFVVFYLSEWAINPSERSFSKSALALLAIPVACSLVGALAAEEFRKVVLGVGGTGFAQDPSWYFGTIEQRFSLDYFSAIAQRLHDAFPYRLLFELSEVIVIIGLSLDLRKNIVAALPFVASFLSGWVVFANLYIVHDYYQLPVTIIYFMFVAVCADTLSKRLFAELKDHPWAQSKLMRTGRNYALCLASVLMVIFMSKFSDFRRETIWAGLEAILHSTNRVLYVDDFTSYNYGNPTIGGYLKTSIVRIPRGAFESNCDEFTGIYRAILVIGDSACMRSHKAEATTYIEHRGLNFYFNANRKEE
jgi:hypothetical protein